MEPVEINLYNFEDDAFCDSKYVLTSPRSLHACDMLRVKPAELLYKPLADFQDELLPKGLPLREIYDQYDNHERLRQCKLRECRDYRDKMIRDKMYKHLQTTDHQNSVKNFYDDGYRSNESLEALQLSDKEPALHNSSALQRLRTAEALRSSSASCDSLSALTAVKQPSRSESVSLQRAVTFSPIPDRPSSAMAGISLSKNKKKSCKSRIKSADVSHRNRYRPTRCLDDFDLPYSMSKSLRISDLTAWRPHESRSTELHNDALRRSLGLSSSGGRVTVKDEKILEALYNKNESEVSEEINRSQNLMRWQEERQKEQQEKEIAESFRRKILAQRIAEAEYEQALLKKRQYQDAEELRRSLLSRYEQNDSKWQLSADRQKYYRNIQSEEKRRKSLERKKSQERMLEEFIRQRTSSLDKCKMKSELDIERATVKKAVHEIAKKMKTKRENRREKTLHWRRYSELKQHKEQLNEDIKTATSQKDARAKLNQSVIQAAKDYETQMNIKERQRKFSRLMSNIAEMENEKTNWRETLNARRKLLEAKATLSASQAVELKSLRAQAERAEKEAKHRETYAKIQEEAELLRRDKQDAIKYKDARMKLVQHHKDKVIGEVRLLAANSQQMREELRQKFGKNSFDKKVLETELINKLGRGHSSATKNKSSVILS